MRGLAVSVTCLVHSLWSADTQSTDSVSVSVAGPTVWNSLPDYLYISAVDSKQFRQTRRRICWLDIQALAH